MIIRIYRYKGIVTALLVSVTAAILLLAQPTSEDSTPPTTGAVDPIAEAPAKEYPFTPLFPQKPKPSPDCTLVALAGHKAEGTILSRVSVDKIRFRLKESGKEITVDCNGLTRESVKLICEVLPVEDLPECRPGLIFDRMLVINPDAKKEETWGETIVFRRTKNYYVELKRKTDREPILFPFEYFSKYDQRRLICTLTLESDITQLLRPKEQELRNLSSQELDPRLWNGKTKNPTEEELPWHWSHDGKWRKADGSALTYDWETNGEEASPNFYMRWESILQIRDMWDQKIRIFMKTGEKIEYAPILIARGKIDLIRNPKNRKEIFISRPPHRKTDAQFISADSITIKSGELLGEVFHMGPFMQSHKRTKGTITLKDGTEIKGTFTHLLHRENNEGKPFTSLFWQETEIVFQREGSTIYEVVPASKIEMNDRVFLYSRLASGAQHRYPEKYAEMDDTPIEIANEETVRKLNWGSSLDPRTLERFPNLRKFVPKTK